MISAFLKRAGLASVIAMLASAPPGFASSAALYAQEKAGNVEELDSENFEEKALENALPSIVNFYSPGCAPCMQMKPVFESVCKEFKDKLFCGTYNTDQDDDVPDSITRQYEVDGIPAFRLFCNGKEDRERRFEGGRPKIVMRYLIKEFLKSCK